MSLAFCGWKQAFSHPFSETITWTAKSAVTLTDQIIYITLVRHTVKANCVYTVYVPARVRAHVLTDSLTCAMKAKYLGNPQKAILPKPQPSHYLTASPALGSLAACFLSSTGPRVSYPSTHLFFSIFNQMKAVTAFINTNWESNILQTYCNPQHNWLYMHVIFGLNNPYMSW